MYKAVSAKINAHMIAGVTVFYSIKANDVADAKVFDILNKRIGFVRADQFCGMGEGDILIRKKVE